MSTPPKSPSTSSPPESPSTSSPPISSLNFTKMCIDNLIYAERLTKEWEAESKKFEEAYRRMKEILEELRKANLEMEEAAERENNEKRRRI